MKLQRRKHNLRMNEEKPHSNNIINTFTTKIDHAKHFMLGKKKHGSPGSYLKFLVLVRLTGVIVPTYTQNYKLGRLCR